MLKGVLDLHNIKENVYESYLKLIFLPVEYIIKFFLYIIIYIIKALSSIKWRVFKYLIMKQVDLLNYILTT